jgi:hypothetical protein
MRLEVDRKVSRLFEPARRDGLDAEDAAAYDSVVQRQAAMHPELGEGGKVDGYRGALLWSPKFAQLLDSMGRFGRAGEVRGTYSDHDRVFADMVVMKELGYLAVGPLEIPEAVAAGVRPVAITAILNGREENLTADELALATFIKELVRGRVTDESFSRMETRFGRRGLVEYMAFVCWLLFSMRLMQALGVPGPGAEEIAALVDGYMSGEALASPTSPPPTQLGDSDSIVRSPQVRRTR